MSFTVLHHEQRSDEWFAARLGVATGSRAGDIVAKIKTGEAAARRDYRTQLVAERLTGQSQEEPFTNADMQRGIDLEASARMAYEAATGNVVQQTGFLLDDWIAAGCSLDGHVEAFAGILEIKCPRTATHIQYLRENRLPPKYAPQVTHNCLISEAKWVDFVSFCPVLPENLQLFTIRVEASSLDLDGYRKELEAFLAEVAEETKMLRNFKRAA